MTPEQMRERIAQLENSIPDAETVAQEYVETIDASVAKLIQMRGLFEAQGLDDQVVEVDRLLFMITQSKRVHNAYKIKK